MSDHKYEKSYQRGKATVIDCQSCGYAHLYPLPTSEDLEAFYQNTYFEEIKTDFVKEQLEEKIFWDINFEDKRETLEQLLSPGSRRILDIGCGNGLFLKYYQRHGWEVMGIEPSMAMAKYAEEIGIPVINNAIENIDPNSLEKFDVVNLSFVLEHVSDPEEVLSWVHDVLNPGGIVLIEVPNEFNEFQLAINKFYNKEMWWISAPDHINYFNVDTLASLLEKTAYEVAHQEATFPMELFVLMGDDYVGNSDIGKKMHKKRGQFEQALVTTGKNHVKRELYKSLAKLGLGRSIIMFARKK